MEQQFNIVWGVHDGYAIERYQSFNVQLSDFGHCNTIEQIQKELERQIQSEFELSTSWYCEDFETYAKDILAAKMEEMEKEAKEQENEEDR